jgi:hypothetical protein
LSKTILSPALSTCFLIEAMYGSHMSIDTERIFSRCCHYPREGKERQTNRSQSPRKRGQPTTNREEPKKKFLCGCRRKCILYTVIQAIRGEPVLWLSTRGPRGRRDHEERKPDPSFAGSDSALPGAAGSTNNPHRSSAAGGVPPSRRVPAGCRQGGDPYRLEMRSHGGGRPALNPFHQEKEAGP